MLSRGSWKLFSRCYRPSSCGRRFVSTPSYKTLEKLGLFPTGGLIERGNRDTRAVESATQGGNKYMTSKEMYRHLNRIQELVPDDSDARPSMHIETILFRTSAMLPGDVTMLLEAERESFFLRVPFLKGSRTRKLSSTNGYRVFVVDDAKGVIVIPGGLFVAESKIPINDNLWDCFPQVIADMYASATKNKGKVVRGVMSNGYEWLFTILHLNENGRGGGYKVSEKIVINFAPDYPNHVDGNEADIIASILAHWVLHCSDDIDENDWFKSKDVIMRAL